MTAPQRPASNGDARKRAAERSAENDAPFQRAETVEYGVWLDENGSTDLYESEAGAWSACRADGGVVVRLTTVLEAVTPPGSSAS